MLRKLFCLCAALLIITACSDDNSTGREKQNILNVYNWADYIAPDTIKKFESEFGIKVNYDIYDSAEIVDVKLLAGNTGYDVIIHSNSFSARIAPVGVYEELDFSRIPNIKHLDPDVMQVINAWDGIAEYQVPYTWGTTGYAWNAEMVRKRLGDHPMDSGDVIFDPAVVSKLADCGVSLLDSPLDVMPMLLAYLGLNPSAVDDESLAIAKKRLQEIRPYIRYFSNAKMLVDLPNKEICVAMSWSGDYATAKWRAAEAGIDIDLRYTAPKEGTGLWVDGIYMPKDARHKDNAYLFINFMLRPDIAAANTSTVNYATANRAAQDLLDPAVLNDPAIFPSEEIMDALFATIPQDPKRERVRTRAYVQAKSGL